MKFSPDELTILRASYQNEDEADALEWGSPPISAVIAYSGLDAEVANQAIATLLDKEVLDRDHYSQGLFHFSIAGLEYALFALGFQDQGSLEKMLIYQGVQSAD